MKNPSPRPANKVMIPALAKLALDSVPVFGNSALSDVFVDVALSTVFSDVAVATASPLCSETLDGAGLAACSGFGV